MTLKFNNKFEIQPSSESGGGGGGGGGGSNLKHTVAIDEDMLPVLVQVQVQEGS